MKGSYVLIINLKKEKEIEIGRLGRILFNKGYYAYVGSGLNNLEKRVGRHLRKNKKKKWHIDYLLEEGKIEEIFYRESDRKEECNIARILSKKFNFIPGFGSSDCKCRSHLFFNRDKSDIVDYLKEHGMQFFKKT